MSSCGQPPKAPVSDWSVGLVDIPKLRYSQIYDYMYLVASKVISADGAEMGAFKSLKAVRCFLKRATYRIEIQPWSASLCVCVSTNTSINEMYPVHCRNVYGWMRG